MATGPVTVMSSPGVPSVTPIWVRPFWVASNSRQFRGRLGVAGLDPGRAEMGTDQRVGVLPEVAVVAIARPGAGR